MADEKKIYHATQTNDAGYGSLMLGYTAKIPTGIDAYYPIEENDLRDYHITFQSYEGLLPAETPAILKIDEANSGVATATYKFYYDGSDVADAANKSTGDDGLIIDGSLYKRVFEVSAYAAQMPAETECRAYMYTNDSPDRAYIYWMYENYHADGTYEKDGSGNPVPTDVPGYVNVNPNRAYIIVGEKKATAAGSPSVLALRFNAGPTTDIKQIPTDYRQAPVEGVADGIFDLQGRKLNGVNAAGIYIIDGKKVLVK